MGYEYPDWVQTEEDITKYNLAVIRHIQGRPGYPDYVKTDEDKAWFNLAITHYNIQNIDKIQKTNETLGRLLKIPDKVYSLISFLRAPSQ
jgi:hypothetical protein